MAAVRRMKAAKVVRTCMVFECSGQAGWTPVGLSWCVVAKGEGESEGGGEGEGEGEGEGNDNCKT